MQLPTGNPEILRAGVERIIEDLVRVTRDPDATPAATAPLPVLAQAFGQLFDVIQRVETDRQAQRAGPEEITGIGEYAFRLHADLAALIEQAGLQEHKALSAALVVDFAVWIAGQEGRIDTLEAVVDALAMLANGITDTRELETLCDMMRRIIDAVSPVIREDLEKVNPGRPWRVLLLNHAIVATRSHDTARMEQALATLSRYLPGDAARFFTEGMQQMEALNYPPQVRAVMEKYHRRWTHSRSLH